jgi:hypothetical protein
MAVLTNSQAEMVARWALRAVTEYAVEAVQDGPGAPAALLLNSC